MMKAQFMSLWDGLDTDHSCQVFERNLPKLVLFVLGVLIENLSGCLLGFLSFFFIIYQ